MPIITSAAVVDGTLQVSAAVNGILDEAGQCTLTMSSTDGPAPPVTVASFADVASTICEPLAVPLAGLTPGTWSATVTYDSPRYRGTSSASMVEVP